jgi:hypothetical protein
MAQDLELVDSEYYNSLIWIQCVLRLQPVVNILRENSIDEACLGMTFAVDSEEFGDRREFELKPGGKSIDVGYSTCLVVIFSLTVMAPIVWVT